MKFFTRLHQGQWELLFQTKDLETLCHLQARDDTIQSWLCGLLQNLESKEGVEQSKRLLFAITDLPEVRDIALNAQNRQTFFRFLHALYRFLHRSESAILAGRANFLEKTKRFLAQLFRFQVSRTTTWFRYEIGGVFDHQYTYGFSIEGEQEDGIPAPLWASALRKCGPYSLEFIIEGFDRLEESVLLSQDAFLRRSFLYFSQALIEVLSFNNRVDPRSRVVLHVCESIVTSEYSTVDEQKKYLERILQQDDPIKVQQRLYRIIDVVKIQHDFSWESLPDRLETLVGLMTDYSLRFYDLDGVKSLWGRVSLQQQKGKKHPEFKERKDLLLSLLLNLYSKPKTIFMLVLVWFFGLAFLSHMEAYYALSNTTRLWVHWLVIGQIGIVIMGGVFGALYLVWRIAWKKDFFYLQLLLPRLWGAIIVGLAMLLIDQYPWRMGLYSTFSSWLILGLVAYAISYTYIFIDVYKATKFLPLSTDQSTIGRAVHLSTKIYLIGIMESFFAVLLTSVLIFPLTDLAGTVTHDFIGGVVCLDDCILVPVMFEYGFFPGLVLLWTGLALFIGSFVQLLWQDRRITESV